MTELLARLNVSEKQGVVTVEFTETKLLDAMKIAEVGQALKDLVMGRERPKLVLDFGNVDYFSSAALGMLVDVQHHVREAGGQMRLSGIKPEIMRIFTLTGLDRVFRVSSTSDGARWVMTRV